ncbi:MAG: PIN domain-containing protein [Fimbriiglobus sp.]|jgi:predicted nucleic acid-binding protein|nr:PIN domain-containing protein [Fimbriiglobus sp.]
MKLYLDSVVVIYMVERHPQFGRAAAAAVSRLAPTALVGTELTRMECLIIPRRLSDAARGSDFDRLFSQKYLPFEPVDTPVFHLATDLRAKYTKVKTPDALHLASAILSGCDCFVTNDTDLSVVTEIRVEVI